MSSDKQRIAKMLVDLAAMLLDDFDVVDFCQKLCVHGSDLLQMGAAGVMLVDSNDELRVLAASSEEVEMLELFEIQRNAGPCVDSHRTGRLVRADNRHDLVRQWPQLGRLVAKHYQSVYAFPIRVSGRMVGALGLYGDPAAALDPDDAPLGQALADMAAISIIQYETLERATVLTDQLQHALTSRVAIEQAKGKYGERHNTTVGVAFEALRTYSQQTNQKLVNVATAFMADELDL